MVGTGSRTFSYFVAQYWEHGLTFHRMGNPEMAHNDYIQTLAEYGIVGLIFAIGVVGLVLGRGVHQVWVAGSAGRCVTRGLQIGAIGGVCAAMVHAGIDFSLHIVPNGILFAVVLGTLLMRRQETVDSKVRIQSRSPAARSSSRGPSVNERSPSEIGSVTEEGLPVSRFGWLSGAISIVLVVFGIVGALIAGARELMVLPEWFHYEQRVVAKDTSGDRKAELKELIEKAPDFKLARLYARISMMEMLATKEGDRGAILEEGLWAANLAVERHPFDGEARLVYANFLEVNGEEDAAAEQYLVGIELVWRREPVFGGLNGFSDHLARRAEGYYQARNPERALAFYGRAQEYLDRSWELNYRPGGRTAYLKKQGFLQKRIEFLEGAGVEAEDLDGVIPPPPE